MRLHRLLPTLILSVALAVPLTGCVAPGKGYYGPAAYGGDYAASPAYAGYYPQPGYGYAQPSYGYTQPSYGYAARPAYGWGGGGGWNAPRPPAPIAGPPGGGWGGGGWGGQRPQAPGPMAGPQGAGGGGGGRGGGYVSTPAFDRAILAARARQAQGQR